MPENVDLSSVSHANGGLTITGTAPSEVEVLSYAKKLREGGLFPQVTIAGMKKTDEGMKFNLSLEMED